MANIGDSHAKIGLLAGAFVDVLASWLTVAEMAEVQKRNAENPDPGICASHDFVDANDAMATAFALTMGREPRLDEEDDDTDTRLWNEAWDTAKKVWLTEEERS